jgi:hypothetical protein
MNAVALSIDNFRASFPDKFTEASDEVITSYFARAEDLIANSETSNIKPPEKLEKVLYMATAHLMALYEDGRGGAVGRISSASQGNVSASFDYPISPTRAWWQQTQYGAELLQATAKIRSFHFIRTG